MAIFGYGEIALLTVDAVGTAKQLFAGPYSSIAIEADVETADARGFINGKLKTTSSAITSEDYTLTIQFQEVDRRSLQLMMQTEAATTASLPLLRGTTAVVPSTAPYTVSVPGVAAGGQVSVVVQGKVAVQVPAADVTLATDSVTLTAAYAGKSVFIQRMQTYTNVQTIGLSQAANSLDVEYTFVTRMYGPNFPQGLFLVAPKATFLSRPGFESGDVSEMEIQMRLNTPAGFPNPFYFAELTA